MLGPVGSTNVNSFLSGICKIESLSGVSPIPIVVSPHIAPVNGSIEMVSQAGKRLIDPLPFLLGVEEL